MKYLIIIVFTFIHVAGMPQSSFTQALRLLYFNANINNSSADALINTFREVKDLKPDDKVKLSMSLSDNLAMHTGKEVQRKTYIFRMLKSPLIKNPINSGYIRIAVGESENKKKILNLEWCIQLDNKEDAEAWFDVLKEAFIPTSTKYQFEKDDTLEHAKYAQFSTLKEPASNIRDITVFFSKAKDSNNYEIRIYPYNEFME